MVSGQFVEDIGGDLFDAVFEFRDFPAGYFVFGSEEFSGVGSWVIDFIWVFKQEQGDGFCRDFVGGGFFQGLALFEVFDEQWVKGCDIIAFGEKVIEDVKVFKIRHKVIQDLVPINLLGMEKAGDILLFGLSGPSGISSPCFQSLSSISNLIMLINYIQIQHRRKE